MHELTDVKHWIAGSSRRLRFTVENEAGPIDVSDATIQWRLFEKDYHTDIEDAVISDSDTGVEVVTDPNRDPEQGEFEVRISEGTTSDLYGEFWHRIIVDQIDDTLQEWMGSVIIEE